MKDLDIVILVEPRSKKNHSQILINPKTKRPFIMPSTAYKKYLKDCKEYMPKLYTPIDYAVNVECKFYMGTKRKVDLTNLLGAIDDVLVEYGVLEDDNYHIIVGHDGSRVLYDKENPRTEIYIREYKKD